MPKIRGLAQMPHKNATIDEIFRLSHIAPMPVARKCTADFVYRNYLVPKVSWRHCREIHMEAMDLLNK